MSCTGSQLILIINSFGKRLYDCHWYAADISVNGFLPESLIESKKNLVKIGRTQELIQIASQINQLFSGIFIAIPEHIIDPDLNGEFDTENDPTEDLGDAAIEIRAFDTSYFEVYYSNYLSLL
jgi:hypothetical protein